MSDTPYRRRFGDRKEGRRIRSLPVFSTVEPFIMRDRNDSQNYLSDSIEVTEIDRWLRAKRAEGHKGLGTLHLFIAAYVRAVSQRPSLNRFVSGRRIYSRNNIEVSMTIKQALTDEAEDSTINVFFQPTDTIFDIQRKVDSVIDKLKAEQGGNDTEKLAGILAKMPRFALSFIVWLLKLGDYFGILPQSFLDLSPFHGSMIITDMGSMGIPPIYHHIYNFGNLPIFISFGAKRRSFELDENGQVIDRKYVDFKVVMDERICDGFYFATSLKYIKHYLRNPEMLETPPEKVEQDVF